jgi:hypothetical protein
VRRLEAAAREPRAHALRPIGEPPRPGFAGEKLVERLRIARDRLHRERIERALEPGAERLVKLRDVAPFGADGCAEAQ